MSRNSRVIDKARIEISSTSDGAKVFITIFIAFGLIITIPTLKKYNDYLTKYESTKATILSVKKKIVKTYYEDHEGTTTKYKITTYKIEIKFFVDNKEIKKVVSYDKYPRVGEKIEIKYNPQNPNQVTTMSDYDIQSKIFIIIIFWTIVAIVAIVIFLKK